jgi:hypothetical protein
MRHNEMGAILPHRKDPTARNDQGADEMETHASRGGAGVRLRHFEELLNANEMISETAAKRALRRCHAWLHNATLLTQAMAG